MAESKNFLSVVLQSLTIVNAFRMVFWLVFRSPYWLKVRNRRPPRFIFMVGDQGVSFLVFSTVCMMQGPSKKVMNRYEKQINKEKQRKMRGKSSHAVTISVEGRKMPL